jgi:vacuolar-type H+-ATPase subunit H
LLTLNIWRGYDVTGYRPDSLKVRPADPKDNRMMKEATEEKKRARKGKQKKNISAQLEEKWVGSRDEILSRIVAKENEIRAKTSEERRKSERMIEDAKGKAASIRREALEEEVGQEEYNAVMERAQLQVEEFRKEADREIERIRKSGLENLDEAVRFIVSSVCLLDGAD